MKYIIHSRIKKIEEKMVEHSHGKDASGQHTSKTDSLGWYMQFEGSAESIKVDDVQPEWQEGDKVKITIEKED